jgi:hypothetical protein
MTRGIKIIALVAAGIIAIGLIFYFVIWPIIPKSAPAPVLNTNAPSAALPVINANVPPPATPAENVPPPAEISGETADAATVRTTAAVFAERLASYSNQNGLKNLDDLKTISTAAVWKYLDGEYRQEILKTMPPLTDYYGVTAKAIRVSSSAAGDGVADATVELQKSEAGTINNVTAVTLRLKLKKTESGWVVTWLEWQK